MHVALYARVSSSRQEQERTIASQVEALERYAADHGYELPEAAHFLDDGFSGARLDRPALDALRDGARAGAFAAVLVLSPDRLARNYAYQVLILEELQRFGVQVIFIEQPPLDDPGARLLVQIQGAVAEYERAKIAERNRRGRLFRLRQGEVSVTRAPYGYRRIPRTPAEPAHMVIYEPEAAVVRQIFAWHANDEGANLYVIAQRLQAQGIPTPRGAPKWVSQAVRSILRNSVYTGSWVVNRTCVGNDPSDRRKHLRPEQEWITLTVPAVIDQGTFLRSQQRHAHNAHYSRRHANAERWLLRGLVRCGECHHACCAQASHSGRDKSHWNYYYVCCNHTTEAFPRCHAPSVRAQELDTLVWSEVVKTLSDPRLLRDAVGGAPTASADSALVAAQRSALQRQLDAAAKERQRLLDAYQSGVLLLPELQPRLASLDLRRQQWEQERERLEQVQHEVAAAQDLDDRLENLAQRIRARLAGIGFTERQALLREVLEAVEATPWEVRLHYRIPLPPGPDSPTTKVSTQLRLRQRGRRHVSPPNRLQSHVGQDQGHFCRQAVSGTRACRSHWRGGRPAGRMAMPRLHRGGRPAAEDQRQALGQGAGAAALRVGS